MNKKSTHLDDCMFNGFKRGVNLGLHGRENDFNEVAETIAVLPTEERGEFLTFLMIGYSNTLNIMHEGNTLSKLPSRCRGCISEFPDQFSRCYDQVDEKYVFKE